MSNTAKTPTDKEIYEVHNYMVIELGYDAKFILPYKEAIKLLAVFEQAERVSSAMYEVSRNGEVIFNNEPFNIDHCIVSQTQYRNSKVAALLGLHNDKDGEKDNA